MNVKRSFLFLLLGSLLLFILGCKSNKDSHHNDLPHSKIKLSSKAILVNQSGNFDFLFTDTIHYYQGSIGSENYYIKVNHAKKHEITGVYYSSNSDWMNPEPFQLIYEDEKYIIKTGHFEYALNFDIGIDTLAIVGSYSLKGNTHNETKNIELVAYLEPDFVQYSSQRYQKPIYSFDKKTDISYGKAPGYWISYPNQNEKYIKLLRKTMGKTLTTKELNLTLDAYLPHNDSIEKRPLIIFLHGGGFYVGDKGALPMETWCTHFAKLGYVSVSLNYRLGFKVSKASIQRCGYQAIQDAHAAVRYLVAHADEYGIDTSEIFLAGTSAGSITALGLIFMTNENRPKSTYKRTFSKELGNIESSGNNLTNKFNIKAVANMWGAVYDLDEIALSPTPIISFHGTDDKLVPFDEGYPFSDIKGNVGEMLFDKMYGSKSIHHKLDSLQVHNEFYPIQGGKHAPYQDKNNKLNAIFYFIQDKIQDFFYAELATVGNIRQNSENTRNYFVNQNDIKKINWKIDGGFIIETKNNSVTVVWRSDAPKHTLIASGIKLNGSTFYKEFTPSRPRLATN